MVGATTTGCLGASLIAVRRQTSLQRKSSTPVARCGPCCSVDATGNSTMASLAASERRVAADNRFQAVSITPGLPFSFGSSAIQRLRCAAAVLPDQHDVADIDDVRQQLSDDDDRL